MASVNNISVWDLNVSILETKMNSGQAIVGHHVQSTS